MGVFTSRQLSVVTLNYSGILSNSFEFYSQQMLAEEQAISELFEAELYTSQPNARQAGWTWKVGKIDQIIQKERYSPIYMQNAGIENGKLIKEARFSELWRQYFQKAKANVSEVFKPDQIENMLQFDLLAFRTLAKYCNFNTEKYQQMLGQFFAKSFLNETRKIQKTIQALQKQKVDVALIQQTSKPLIDALQATGYYDIVVSSHSTSAILLRVGKFRCIHDTEVIMKSLGPKFQYLLNWNDDTVVAFVDHLVLISGHISSKSQKNKIQIQQMKVCLQELRAIYPMLNIIVGMDANTFVEPLKNFYSFPSNPNTFTTIKKRTWLQPQIKKANQLVKECKDHILTTLPHTKERVVTISGDGVCDKTLIPTDSHPYDHFVVNVHIKVPIFQRQIEADLQGIPNGNRVHMQGQTNATQFRETIPSSK